MTLQTIPYVEKLAADHLRTHPDIVALGARVLALPADPDDTLWVQVTKLDAANSPSSTVEHLIAYLIQFDCYAGAEGGAPEANLLGRTVRAVLVNMPGEVAGAVISSARIVGDIRLPDFDFKPARDRVIITARIHAHA